MSQNRDFARQLRRDMTDAEKFLWNQLRGRRFGGIKFRRQAPIGPYIVDFVCLESRVIVELDGAGHAEPEQQAHDERRSAWLATEGYRVLRFSNEAVLTQTGQVEQAIWDALRGRLGGGQA